MKKENNAILKLTSSQSCGRQNMRDIRTLLTAPISRIKTLRDDEGRKDKENVGQVVPDNQIKRHSRMSLSGIPTSFNNAQGGAPRQQPSGMTTNLNNIPLTRHYMPPSPSWRGNMNNPLPPKGGRCPVRADEGGNHNTLAKPLPSPRSVGMRGIRGASLYPALQACGMTSEASTPAKRGFTLIELLVVILIIGILAAIALPQYQKAVERSRAGQALAILNTFIAAERAYYLEHGVYASSFDELDVSISLPGRTSWLTGRQFTDARSNDHWSLVLESTKNNNKYGAIFIGKLKGKYKGGGFSYYFQKNPAAKWPIDTPLCFEYFKNKTYTLKKGDYCQKIMGATYLTTDNNEYIYVLKK